MMGDSDVPVVVGVVIPVCPTVLMLSAADICRAAIAPFRLCRARGRLAAGKMRLGPTIIQPMQRGNASYLP